MINKVELFLCVIIFGILNSSIDAAELRAIIEDPQNARAKLACEKATYLGDYAFDDYIYSDLNSNRNLNEEFFRIRVYKITKWEQKPVVVVHKIQDPHLENHRILLLEKECDTITQAQEYIPQHFSRRCSFFRQGWEYRLDDMRIFVEEIDGLPPSIEIVAPSQNEIVNLFDKIKVVKILTDSVPEWYCKEDTSLKSQGCQ